MARNISWLPHPLDFVAWDAELRREEEAELSAALALQDALKPSSVLIVECGEAHAAGDQAREQHLSELLLARAGRISQQGRG